MRHPKFLYSILQPSQCCSGKEVSTVDWSELAKVQVQVQIHPGSYHQEANNIKSANVAFHITEDGAGHRFLLCSD